MYIALRNSLLFEKAFGMMRKTLLIEGIGKMINKSNIFVRSLASTGIQAIERHPVFALRPSSSLALNNLLIDAMGKPCSTIRTKVVQAFGESVGKG